MSLASFNFSLPHNVDTTITRTITLNGEPVDLVPAPLVLYIDSSEQGNSIWSIVGTVGGVGNNLALFIFDNTKLFLGDKLRYRILWLTATPQEFASGTINITSDNTPYASKIEYVHNLINLYTDKGLTGYHSPADIDNAIHAVSLNMYREYYDQYAESQKISDYLSCFQSPRDLTLTSGKASTDIDPGHIVMAEAAGYEVDVIEKSDWLSRKNHPIKIPDAKYPFCTINGGYVEVLPTSTTSITLTYLREPSKPVYGTTVSDGRLVFDNISSFDIEWPEMLLDVIADRTLLKLGINLRDEGMIRDSQIEDQNKTQ